MKNIFFIGLVIAYSFFSFCEEKIDLDFSEKKLNTENMIKNQLTGQLLPFFKSEDFNLIIQAKLEIGELEKTSEKEINKVESEDEEEVEESNSKNLPGFSLDVEENEVLTKEKKRYYSFLQLVSVDVTLIVEESLKESRKILAKDIVEQKIRSSYGDKATFIYKESKLHQSKEFREVVEAYIAENKDIVLLFSVFIFALFFLFMLFNRMMAARDENNMKALTTLSKSSIASAAMSVKRDPVEKEETAKEKYIEALMHVVRDEPFVARASFENLTVEEKSAILVSVETDLLKKSLLSMMKTQEKDIVSLNDEAKIKEHLKSVLDQMKENVSIQKVLMNQRFGYLNYLEPKEVLILLGDLKNPKNLAIVSQYMPASKYYDFSKLLDESTKVEIFKALNNKENPISEEDKKNLDQEMKKGVEAFSDKILSGSNSNESAIENFLNNDPKIASVVSALKKDSSFKFDEDLNKYALSFVDMLKDNFEKAAPILLNEENEVLAASITNLEEDLKNIVLNKFGKMRREIMQTLLKGTKFSEEEIDKAQSKILKVFREKI